MSTRRERSRIPRATRSSSPTDSTVSSATSIPKRHCDLPYEDDNSDGPPPRSREPECQFRGCQDEPGLRA
ncbi:hypothetical protein PIB30_044236 [Stylosanthes scabra]|uniref:Uncharacterized protein n=1 Tax=Stylosanthes scabra TaxID=79078 RepID=A0ABU6WGV1_9FABA|nr:hypothetical protein [Stylosanthes scabra]